MLFLIRQTKKCIETNQWITNANIININITTATIINTLC